MTGPMYITTPVRPSPVRTSAPMRMTGTSSFCAATAVVAAPANDMGAAPAAVVAPPPGATGGWAAIGASAITVGDTERARSADCEAGAGLTSSGFGGGDSEPTAADSALDDADVDTDAAAARPRGCVGAFSGDTTGDVGGSLDSAATARGGVRGAAAASRDGGFAASTGTYAGGAAFAAAGAGAAAGEAGASGAKPPSGPSTFVVSASASVGGV
mmetsp:Transcript_19545/g.69202  ORF Transcript_19545/g.69202 Transcript_19545/m.69202 type:complete len:214 (+) Transcript_19545:454-1095(+)